MNKVKDTQKNNKKSRSVLLKGVTVGLAGMALLGGAMVFTGCDDDAKVARWLSGEATPTSRQGDNGDFYIDTDDNLLYQKNNGKWSVVMTNFGGTRGEDGEDGDDAKNIEFKDYVEGDEYIQWRYEGSNNWMNLVPVSALQLAGPAGKPAQLRVNEDLGRIEWKVEGDEEWLPLMSLSLLKGADGATWLSGDKDETTLTNEDGKVGDFYLNTTSFDIYKKTSDGWVNVGNIKGEAAPTVVSSYATTDKWGIRTTVTYELSNDTSVSTTYDSVDKFKVYGAETSKDLYVLTQVYGVDIRNIKLVNNKKGLDYIVDNFTGENSIVLSEFATKNETAWQAEEYTYSCSAKEMMALLVEATKRSENAGKIYIKLNADVEVDDNIVFDQIDETNIYINLYNYTIRPSNEFSGDVNTGLIVVEAYFDPITLTINGKSKTSRGRIDSVSADGTKKIISGIAMLGSLDSDGSTLANIDLKYVDVNGNYYALTTGGRYKGNGIVAKNCSFTASDTEGSTAIYLAGNNNSRFTNSTFTGATGAYIKSGNVTMNSCTIEATGVSNELVHNGSGYVSTGDGIVLNTAAGYYRSLKFTIIGGSVTSANGYALREGYTAPEDSTEVPYYAVINDRPYSEDPTNMPETSTPNKPEIVLCENQENEAVMAQRMLDYFNLDFLNVFDFTTAHVYGEGLVTEIMNEGVAETKRDFELTKIRFEKYMQDTMSALNLPSIGYDWKTYLENPTRMVGNRYVYQYSTEMPVMIQPESSAYMEIVAECLANADATDIESVHMLGIRIVGSNEFIANPVESVKSNVNNVMAYFKDNVYNNTTVFTEQRKYSYAEAKSLLGGGFEFYIDLGLFANEVNTVQLEGGVEFNTESVSSISIGQNRHIEDKVFFVDNCHLYMIAPIVAFESVNTQQILINGELYYFDLNTQADNMSGAVTLTSANESGVRVTSAEDRYQLYYNTNLQISETPPIDIAYAGASFDDLVITRKVYTKDGQNCGINYGVTTLDADKDGNPVLKTYFFYATKDGIASKVDTYTGMSMEYTAYVIGKGMFTTVVDYNFENGENA